MPTSPAADGEALARVGEVLDDKWTLERLLGIGGMAAVYAGRHRNGARAAIKVLHPEYARHAEVRERFLREGYAANKVEHPGVVKVLDDDVVTNGPDAGTAYLVMELLEGESLQQRVERGPALGEREFLEIADGILDVLRAAHDCGVVHRDLKPENLFFAREDDGKTRIKVLDFGLARVQSAQAITTYGLALGTPSFMSPEQAAGKSDQIDRRTDLFTLAATGFRLRTGRRIHEADSVFELVTKMANLPAPAIRTVAPDVSEPYARVIDRGLQFKREDRYESAAAMQQDVRRAVRELDARLMMPAPRAPARSPAVAPPLPPRALAPTVPAERPRPQRAQARSAPAESSEVSAEPIRIPRRRRSILPWVTLLVWGGIGVKLWLDAQSDAPEPADTAPASSAPGFGSTGDAVGPDAGRALRMRPRTALPR